MVIGASTGGPQALTRLVAELPEDFPVPIAIALHMPVGYTASLAARLDGLSRLSVVEASPGLAFTPGIVVVGRAGKHLKLVADPLRVALDAFPAGKPHHPSVDVLFESAAEVFGARVLAVVLTGMGDDGLEGARALSKRRARRSSPRRGARAWSTGCRAPSPRPASPTLPSRSTEWSR